MKLKKDLNFLGVFSITTGAMLSGLFLLPGLAFEIAGPALLASYALAAFLALTGLLSQAELVTAMPKAGGAYFYITRSMGSAVGTVYGLITWFSLALKSAYELFLMAAMIAIMIHLDAHLIAVGCCLIFMLINIFGIKEASVLQTGLVFLLLLALAYYCLRAAPDMDMQHFSGFKDKAQNIIPVAGFIFISFGGLLKIASVAEEIKNPGHVIPRAMLLSLFVVVLFTFTVVFITIAALDPNTLAGSRTPLADTAEATFGNSGKILLTIAAIIAVITSANAGIMTASRYPFALARDEMLPQPFAKINKRFHTPIISILITGLVIILAFFLDIHMLVKAASSVLILTYIFTCLSVLILRESRVQNYQPQFKAPLYPWLQLIGIVGFLILLFQIGVEALLMSCLLMVVGFMLFWFYGRKKTMREYALLHLIERITSWEITTHSLETELKEIVHERDEILKDRFDHLIESCPVLDVDQPMNMEEFFYEAGKVLADHLNSDSAHLTRLFLKRERESSTVLNPFLAIPHIIIDGENLFTILLARSKEGFFFSDKSPKVHTVFLLVGSKDERPFHLLSLAAIAQLVQDPDFDKRWLAAKNKQSLRDILLLGKRKRHN
ncbi:MAG: amino acid permease [Planctomycetes bacterium]|nr:amino acid permease [Planctomycetota bacterium]